MIRALLRYISSASWQHVLLPMESNVQTIGYTATRLNDGKVLIAGVIQPGGVSLSKQAEIYDPRSHSFVVTSTVLTPRIAHAAVLLEDGRVLVVGGAAERVLLGAEFY